MGYEYLLKPGVMLTASFRTNNSYYDKGLTKSAGIILDVTTWNIYHFAARGTFTKGRSKMSVGILYSKGNDNSREQNGNFENPSEDNFLQGSATITKATYNSFGLLLGYSVILQK